MSPETLAYLIQNIGGSSKRRPKGADLGVTATENVLLSPKGRRLIGRIGIGLFSVSQLTQSFQIITKVEGDDYRTVAAIVMRQYGEEKGPGTEEDDYEAGQVRIWREPAADRDSHGTQIVLDAIRPQTRRTLQSDSLWAQIEIGEEPLEEGDEAVAPPKPPRFHVGRVLHGGGDQLRPQDSPTFDAVPWTANDSPQQAFSSLVDAVWDAIGQDTTNPRLEDLFDEYLRMVWQLALSIPLPYVDGHPFLIPFGEDAFTYELSGGPQPEIAPLRLSEDGTLADACNLSAQRLNAETPFTVTIDDLQLSRPLRFTKLPRTAHALKKPIIAAGSYRETFEGVPVELSGGPLSFEAYLLWNPKIAPTEHQGSLIRIHGASGTLFDSSFMRYQISEQTRRQQTSCEIFVSEGLEGALNIDRESFNFAHPHVVFLSMWLHGAMRRLASTQKALAAGVRKQARLERNEQRTGALTEIVSQAWVDATGDEDVVPPDVRLRSTGSPTPAQPVSGSEVLSVRIDKPLPSRGSSAKTEQLEEQVAAIASILAAHGVLDALPHDQFESLLLALTAILLVED